MNCYYCHKELDSKTSKTIFIARFLDGKRLPDPCDAQPVCVCEEEVEKLKNKIKEKLI